MCVCVCRTANEDLQMATKVYFLFATTLKKQHKAVSEYFHPGFDPAVQLQEVMCVCVLIGSVRSCLSNVPDRSVCYQRAIYLSDLNYAMFMSEQTKQRKKSAIYLKSISLFSLLGKEKR